VERDWLTATEFSYHLSVTTETVNRWIREGKVKSQPHPTRSKYNVIPYSEVRRILQFEDGNIVAYDGRTYPHQVFLFYLSAVNGLRIGATKKELAAFRLQVPSDDELIDMAKAAYESAPKALRPIFNSKRSCTRHEDFEDWIERLGFGELFEDPLDFIPYHVMKSRQVRWAMEICSSAGFKPIDTSNLIRQMCDVIVDPRQVSNYIWLFHYTRQMPQEDWRKWIAEEYRRDHWRATVREECIDNPVGVFRHFKIRHEMNMPDSFEEMVWQMKHNFDMHIGSRSVQRQNHAVGIAKAMNSIFSTLLRAKEMDSAASDALHAKRQAASGYMEGGLAPGSIPEKSTKDEAPTFEELVDDYQERVAEKENGDNGDTKAG
jgi:hypothetical protein